MKRIGWLAALLLLGCDDGGERAAPDAGAPDAAPPDAAPPVDGVPDLFLGPSVRFPACAQPGPVAAADLDGDGRLDLVVACGEGVAVLRGAGDGTFGAPRVSGAGGTPGPALATGDFDGDGRTDVAVGLREGGAALLPGDGAGGLAAPVLLDAGGDVTALAAAQLDGRGGDDLAAASRADARVSVFTGGAAPPFRVSLSPPLALAAFDADGDGDLDLAAGGALDVHGFLVVLAGAGDGTFAAAGDGALLPAPEVRALATGDFDGDGAPALVVATDAVAIAPGGAPGRFVAADRGRGGVPVALGTGDYDGDGHLVAGALVAFGAGPAAFTVLRGDGAGGVRAPDLFFGAFDAPAGLAGGDFDGDGRPDVAVTDAGGVAVLLDRTQPTGGELGDDAVCRRACARTRACAGLDLPACHDECLLAPALLECARGAPDDCAAVAACAFLQQCGAAPAGALTCAEAVACEEACIPEGRDCACECAARAAAAAASPLLAVGLCADERCPACAGRTDPQACLDCRRTRCSTCP